ncbi:mucin-2 [Betta splendens]|uniref:Mucin-2 n=1 Tax=Betta splendens TaxID=158456 RepID=A0A6P7LXC4_BETSP|nr:mucin-2 [Betta splendens]
MHVWILFILAASLTPEGQSTTGSSSPHMSDPGRMTGSLVTTTISNTTTFSATTVPVPTVPNVPLNINDQAREQTYIIYYPDTSTSDLINTSMESTSENTNLLPTTANPEYTELITTLGTIITTEGSTLSDTLQSTTEPLETTNSTTVQKVTTGTSESINPTSVPKSTTVPPESSTEPPESTSVPTENTNIPPGSTITTTEPETNSSTSIPENTSVPPESSTEPPESTSVPTENTTIPPGSTISTSEPETNSSTSVPDSTTVPPESSTEPPESTSVPTENTTIPSESTSSTSEPETNSSTSVPESTSVPPESSTEPPESTSVPTENTTIPPGSTISTRELETNSSTSVPDSTTVRPESSTEPPESTSVPTENTIIPPGSTISTSEPETNSSTSVPDSTTVPPESSTEPPESTYVPTENTTIPSESTSSTSEPETNSSTSIPESTSVPPESSTEPPESTSVPTENTTIPPGSTISTSEPETNSSTSVPYSTTVPPESSTEPPESSTEPPETTYVPTENTTIPSESTSSTSEPETNSSTSVPESSTEPPESTSVPTENTTIPPGSTISTREPETNSSTSVPDSTTVPPESSTEPPESTSVPTENSTIPPGSTISTSEPETNSSTSVPDSTTVPPEISTEPPESTSVPTENSTIPPGSTISTSEPETNSSTSVPESTTVPPESTTVMIPTSVESTTGPSTATTTTAPPLLCLNGGVLLNGVCVCPDEWTGNTCSVENFCNAEVLETFRFPSTPVGWFAYSIEVCPVGTISAGKPKATTRCSNQTGSPGFHQPHILQCDQTLNDIQKNLTHVVDLETLAASTQILTSNPKELTSENVTTAAEIVNTLLLTSNTTQGVRVAAIATVSQLLNASVSDNTEESTATLSLTKTLDQLSVNLSSTLNTSQSQIVQPNLVVQSVHIKHADTEGVQFSSLIGLSGNFVANRIHLNTNTSTAVNGDTADALIYVRFPTALLGVGAHQKSSDVSLGFVLYQNDHFFKSRLYRRRRATIRVLSGSIRGQDSGVVPQHVEMLFRPRMVEGTSLYDFACVFWDFSLQDWSTAGCYKANTSYGELRCFCNHTTNFAALWSFRQNHEYAEALGIISIVGLSISIVGLVITIIHHINENFLRKQRKNTNSKIALLSIYVSLLAFIITFLCGVENSSRQDDAPVQTTRQTNVMLDSDEHVEPDRGSCSAVVALLHFFLLATFMWNTVYGTQLVLLLRSMQRSVPTYWTKVSITVGWGVPAVVMAITLGVTYRVDNPLGYRQEEFCWLAALDTTKEFNFSKPMFWAFLLPLGLILMYNVLLVVLISSTICRAAKLSSTNHWTLTKKFFTSVSLTVLLGLSWTLGYLVLVTAGHAHLVFSILFCLCTTTQGFQIFILFTARTRSFRAAMSQSVQCASTINIPLHTTTYSFNKHKDIPSTVPTESYRNLGDEQRFTSKDL